MLEILSVLFMKGEIVSFLVKDYVDAFKEYRRKYPDAGYGGRFKRWFLSDSREPYNSYGNGSAMRVSPVAFAFSEIEDVL